MYTSRSKLAVVLLCVPMLTYATTASLPKAALGPTFMPRTITTVGKDVFVLRDPLTLSFKGDLPSITVPAGFITDLASIPKALHWWEGKTDATMAPAIIHDYLYWYQPCEKDEADAVMYVAMRSLNVSSGKSAAIFQVVSDYRAAYAENARRRSDGEVRTLTDEYAAKLRQSTFDPNTPREAILIAARKDGGLVEKELADAGTKKTCAALLRACDACREYLDKKLQRQ
jgi:Protein of unknown function (DUF1353)